MTDNETESKDQENQHPEYKDLQEPVQENESDQDDTVAEDTVAEEAGVAEEPGSAEEPRVTKETEATQESGEVPDGPRSESPAEEPVSDEPHVTTQEDAPQEAIPENTASEEIKMVIALKDGTGTVGIKKPDTDIFFESFQRLDMDLLIEEVPGVIRNARAQWEENPKYPAHERPTKPPTTRRQNTRQRATNNPNNSNKSNNGNNAEPETPLEGRAPQAAEAPREIQQALL